MRVLGSLIAASIAATPALASAAVTPLACCTGKLGQAAKLASTRLVCVTKSDPACITKAEAKLDKFFAARAAKGCSSGNEPALVKFHATELETQLAASAIGHDGSACTVKQMLALAKYVKNQLKVEAMDQKKPDPVKRAERLAENVAKLNAAFAKAATLAGCHTTDPGVSGTPGGLTATEVLAFHLPAFEIAVCPVCDDGSISPAEECEHDGSGLCLAASCTPECRCAVCGNGILEAGEHCDGAQDAACPGQCNASCGCDGPAAVCGNGFVDGGEECDGANAEACEFSDPFVATCAPPGDPVECDCCAAVGQACEFFGSLTMPCCGGATCEPPDPPQMFVTGVCVAAP